MNNLIRDGGITINLIEGVEGINSIGRGWQSRKNEDFQSPDLPYLQVSNQQNSPIYYVFIVHQPIIIQFLAR